MPDIKYTIRSPQSDNEWNEVKNLLQAYRNEFDDDTCFPSFEKELDDLEGIYSNESNHFLICISKSLDEISGCIALHHLHHEASEMRRLYVVPKYRGQHLGTLLTKKAISLATKKGYKSIYLDTMNEMKAAQKLYLGMGFSKIKPYKNQDITKLICFHKALNSIEK